jgi:hypothetical protein
MTAVSNQFYVTLFSNSWRKIYKDTLFAFTIKLERTVDLNYAENLEVGICEVTYPPPIVCNGLPLTTLGNTHVLVYCNVISPQFVGNDMVRCLRTFIFPSSHCNNIFDKIYYMPVEHRKFQLESSFFKSDGTRVPFRDRKIPTKAVHFRKNYHWWSVIKHDVSTVIECFY